MRHVAAAMLGALVATAVVLVHRDGPLVLALAVAASVVTAVHLRAGRRPSLASAFCGGWVVLLVVVLAGRPEGDWAVGADLVGYTVMATGLGLVVLGVTALGRRSGDQP